MLKMLLTLMCIFSVSWHLNHFVGQVAHGSSDCIITRPGDSLSKLAVTHGYQDVASFARAVHFNGNLNQLPVGLALELPTRRSATQYARRSKMLPPIGATVTANGLSNATRERLGFLAALGSVFVAVVVARRHNKAFASTKQTASPRCVAALDRLDAVFANATKAPERRAA